MASLSPEAIQDLIRQNARLPSGITVTGQTERVIPAVVMAKGAEMAASKTVTVGDPPEAFGKGFIWDREDNQVLLVAYLNAADYMGISIDGLQAGDRITVTAVTGLASFDEDDGSTARSLIGLVASAASVGSGIAGHPEAIPFIQAAEEKAEDLFRPDDIHTKRRDAFGVDPGPGFLALQEGGVLVSLPDAGSTYYSGSSESRWIKGKRFPFGDQNYAVPGSGVRVPENNPDHVQGAFFLRREEVIAQTSHTTHVNGGTAFLIAWDSKFSDNAGYYKLWVRLEKNPSLPPVE